MHFVLALIVGALYAAGTYMILRRSLVKFLIGLSLLGHGANLLIFTAGGLTRDRAPLLEAGSELPLADPMPQALVLTAIVISFGVLAFTIALAHRVVKTVGTDDVDELISTDR